MALFGNQSNEADGSPKNLAEVFPPGTPFRLVRLESLSKTPQGQLAAVIVTSPVDAHEREEQFGVWGSLSLQLTQLEAGELPAIVTLSDDAGAWQFVPHGPQGTTQIVQPGGVVEDVPQRVNVEAHMVADAVSEPPLGPVSDRPAPPAPEVPEGGHRQPVPTEPPSVKPTAIDESQTFQPGPGGQ